ncbi:hypothetical protein [Actinomadura rupiterrae]|uniref:hypothetical protein n=1 Tax=Actinomadura rupiterrae TaxID=559627 RepID=UPI0020A49F4D|nr:hypothetical protein [Actinomadura rupiterrae]MCP2340186.1 copper oxidase (laccase) domain-containing protein [Actinomadura rupiterrae]
MAGRRRAAGKPLLSTVKATRVRNRYAARFAEAGTVDARVSTAADFVRAAFGPAAAPEQVAPVVAELLQAADRVWAERHRSQVQADLAAADTGSRQVAVAARYLRAALGPAPSGKAMEIAEAAVQRMRHAAENQIGGR